MSRFNALFIISGHMFTAMHAHNPNSNPNCYHQQVGLRLRSGIMGGLSREKLP